MEEPDLMRGDMIRFAMTLYSVYEKLNPSKPDSYWWTWSCPEIEIIFRGD